LDNQQNNPTKHFIGDQEKISDKFNEKEDGDLRT